MEGRWMMLKILRLTPWLFNFFCLKLNTRKAAGPDNICGRLLKLCTFHLSVFFSQLLTWSLKENTTFYLENLCSRSTNACSTSPSREEAVSSISNDCFLADWIFHGESRLITTSPRTVYDLINSNHFFSVPDKC